jgi:hypothetical protein
MPSRILREGILTSERIAKLGWPEEVFYRRLMSVVDDFGRYYATPMLLRAACYPLQLDKVSDADIGKWTRCAEEAGLVSVYPASDGKRYLQLLDFRQQVRAKDSKFPSPAEQVSSACVADAKQVIANAHLDVDVSVDVSEGESGAHKARSRKVKLQAWMDSLPEGEDAIRPEDPIFTYAKDAGIPVEYLELCWSRFVEDMTEKAKTQIDWRAHYRNAVRGNWYKLWWFDGDACQLTTAGKQAARTTA